MKLTNHTCACNDSTSFECEVQVFWKRRLCKFAEICLEKHVKSHQVKLFLAGFNHLKPQWRVVSSVKKQRPQRTQARALKKTKIETAFRGQDKRVKITVYTIRPYFLFHYLTNPGRTAMSIKERHKVEFKGL